MAASTHSQVPSAAVTDFFKLPPELRLAIYGLALTKPDRTNIKNSRKPITGSTVNGSIILPAMMRVSRTMREDASELCQKHLLDARSVLYGLEKAVQEKLEVAEGHWRGWAMNVTRLSIGEHRQHIEDGREWMARIDEVVAKLELLI
ncbi:hypothetical protein LTR17_005780 [Elasticomyces elasticus]|nr:hypothetical protein LTR17_005780 [Elasticomyces elasticus]